MITILCFKFNEKNRLDNGGKLSYNIFMATLYRKYRSRRFEDVIGQDPIVRTLENQIKLGRVGHAYLFTGSRGIGKTSCARIFARAVNCLHPVNGSPCGECEACKALSSPENVDIIELDAASNNGVDDARDIREKVKYMPVVGKYKVYIIDEAHMLTGGAFNALLKTLEEPPAHVIFILATTEPQKLPQTILSRCIRFDFKLVSVDELAKHVARVYDAEGIKYTPEAAREIARLGEGSVRDALSIADTIASAAELITPEVVLQLTGSGDADGISELFDCAATGDVAGALVAIDGFAKAGKSMFAVCRQVTDYSRNVLVLKSVGAQKSVEHGLINADKATLGRFTASAGKADLDRISRILEHFGAAESGLKYSVNPRVFLETALVKLVCGVDEQDLAKRITALERKLANNPLPAGQKKNITTAVEPPAHTAVHAPQKAEKTVQNAPSASDAYEPEPPPPPDYMTESAPSAAKNPPKASQYAAAERQPPKSIVKAPDVKEFAESVKSADEGEFMHFSATKVSGMELIGAIAKFLRKKGTAGAARARELLSRGVAVKERDDYISFVVPDEIYLSVSDKPVIDELNAALDGIGIEKRAAVDKTAEDLLQDDIARARELFGRDGVTYARR